MPDKQQVETSFKPLTVSSKLSAVSTTTEPEEVALKVYAAERSRLLFGCYRKGDANDPDTYVAAVTAVLAKYPRDVIRSVTHPASGLPTKLKFLPSVAEVHDACEELMTARREEAARKKRIERQLAERAEFEQRNKVFRRGSDEAKAILVLHQIVDRQAAFYQIFRRPDGSVIYSKPMTPRLVALAQAPDDRESWPVLTHQQAGAWEALLRTVFDAAVLRTKLRDGSKAPWPWPPSIEGKIYTDPEGVPPLTDDDCGALQSESGRG